MSDGLTVGITTAKHCVFRYCVLSWLIAFGGTVSPAIAQAVKKLDIPKPENVVLTTNDGLRIHSTYFAGGFVQKAEKEVVAKTGKEKEPVAKTGKEKEVVAKPGKEVVPVILLHGFEGNRKELEPLALMLQQMGHAVITLDLRGHGESNKVTLPNGTEKDIDPGRLRSSDFQSMVNDVEAAKKFLLEKNNAGVLNLELLCLVGAELGGIVATNWIAADWSRVDLPAFKQGKYAKALVVLSPTNSVKGYNSAKTWTHPIFQSPRFSLMLVAGKRDAKSSAEASSIHKRLEKAHPLPTDEKERGEKQSLFLIEPETELVGTKLLDPRTRLPIATAIAQFITLRLVNKESEYPWGERKNPLSGK